MSRQRTEVDKVRVLFIGGIGRSGTTVFELSLATDQRTVSLGEVTHLWQRSLLDDELCGCGHPFSVCPFWTAVGKEAFGGWSSVDVDRILWLKSRLDRTLRVPQISLRLGRRMLAEAQEYSSYYRRVYQAARQVSGCEVVIDSSKQASLPYLLRLSPEIDLRLVHCIRDSRAVAYSWTRTVRRPEARTQDGYLMTRYSPGLLAVKWTQHNVVVEGLRLQGVPTMRLRYEDWANDPVGSATAALTLAGLAQRRNDNIDHSWIDLGVNHTCSGNPMRFTTGRLEIRRDEKWRTGLSRSSRTLVSLMTAPGLAAYGYAWRNR